MAELLEQDEELMRQEEQRLLEAERQRLLEEAITQQHIQDAPAAEFIAPPIPEPVWQGSSGAAIDEFNAQPAIFTGAPGSVDSQQYANELARAQRGSGFINADVGVSGNVITPGYDPERDLLAIKARQEATNLQRNNYVNSLVQGGATYAEALRAGLGRYPQANDANLMLKAESLALKQRPTLLQPEIRTVDGVRVLRTGPNSFSRLQEPKIQGGRVSPSARARDDILKDQITALRKRIAVGASDVSLLSPEETAAIESQIAQKERERVALFETPEANPNIDQPAWLAMRDRFNATAPQRPAQITSTETVKETSPQGSLTITTKEQFDRLPSGSVYSGKDGKKYRKP